MREHIGLFRGKRTDNGEWVEGSLWVLSDRTLICKKQCGARFSRVDPDTIGECTGLKDKNGKLIFEGDIFEWGYYRNEKHRYVVEYDPTLFSYIGKRKNGFVTMDGFDFEIIDNIHDNPELLKGGEGQ